MKNTTISRIRKAVPCAMRQCYFGLLLLLSLAPVVGSAQTGTIAIGSGTAASSGNLPINTYYEYSYSQQIVKASDYAIAGGAAGPITKLRYYITFPETPLNVWNNWTVYVGHTSKTSFTSTTDWVPASDLTQVYTGTITQVANTWMEITFTTPFVYDGVSNLVIAVHENVPGYAGFWSPTYFGSYTGDANTGLYFRDDTVDPNPASPPAGTRTSTLARIQLVGQLTTCSVPPAITSTAGSTTTGTISWTAPATAPANGYEYYHATTNTPPTAATTPTGTTAAGVTTASLSGLTSNTTYSVWVRSVCSDSDVSAWSAVSSFTTLCDPTGMPYTQNFEAVTPPALPECTIVQNAGTGNNWKTIANPEAYGFNSKVLNYSYNSANAGNSWFFTRGLNLTAGTSYRISYKYGNNSAETYTEKMKVAYGTATNAAAMTTVLADHTAITGAMAVPAYVDFVPETTGVYYIGFNAYSIANQDQLYLDDITVDVSPSCIEPNTLVAGTSGETSISLSWAASESNPTGGYQYYYSTANTPPTAATAASGTVGAGILTADISSLTPSTEYFVWVRSDCGEGSFSAWSGPIAINTLCDSPSITSATPGSVCGEGSVQLQATTDGDVVKWYDAATGGTILATGNTFATPVIDATTSYYVEGVNESSVFVGPSYTGTTTNTNSTSAHGIAITTTQPNITINSVDIPFTGTGTFTIALKNSSNSTVITSVTTGSVTGSGTTSVTVPLNLTIQDAGSYLLIVNSVSGSISGLGYSTATYPFTTPDESFSITGGYWYGTTSSNMYLYNLNVTVGCASPRQEVVATVTTAPAVEVSVTENSICAGETTTLSVTSENAGYEYMWMPGNLEGATQSVTPSATTTYTLTATDASTNCVVTEEVTVVVNSLPSALVLAESTTVCEGGDAVELSAEGGITVATLLSEDFNAATNNWITTNNSTGGTPADAAWTLRPDGYEYSSNEYHSNDNTQFYMTNSDDQGLGGTTATILRSPVFSTVGYESANVVFHHYYNHYTGSTAKVEASLNGTDWTTLTTYNSDLGDYDEFDMETVALTSAFLNQPTVYVRFIYNASYGYYWAIDNVSVSGQQSSSITWAPATGLFTDAAGTIAYTGEPAATVYAMPSATTTYTATAGNAFGCTVTDEIIVNYSSTPAPTGTGTVTLCGGSTVNDLTAEGEALVWYADAATNTPLADDTELVNGTSYFASQTVNGCESQERYELAVTLTTVDAPGADAEQTVCNAGTIADLTADAEDIQWYADAEGGEALADDTSLVNGTVYYVSQTVNGCESTERTPVTALVPVVAQPVGEPAQVVQENEQGTATIADIDVTGEGLVWYATEEDALAAQDPLSETQLLVSGTTYYVTQTIGSCTSAPLAVTVTVSLDNIKFDADAFTYYPNPVKNVLNISYSSDITSVTVYNLLGQQVMAKEVNAATGTIDMSVLQDGTYLVKVASGDSVKTIKVIKKQ